MAQAEVRLGIAGAAGRMGRTLITLAEGNPALTVSAAIEHSQSPFLGQDAGLLAGGAKTDVLIVDSLQQVIGDVDVLIDFTLPESTVQNLAVCAEASTAMVVGTTGLGDDTRHIDVAAKKVPVVFAPNMSVGVNLCFRLLETAARVLGDDFDVEIVEAHHRHKVDAPSGTALRMGEIVADALGRDLKRCAVFGREGRTGPRDRETIGFETIRAGEIVGDHTVLFAGAGERIEISHHAADRSTFASGALRAAQWVSSRAPGRYDMADVLGFNDV